MSRLSLRSAQQASGRVLLLILVVLLMAAIAAASVRQAPAAAAATPLTVEYVDSIGGGTPVVAIAGTYAYLGEGSSLTILDISNPDRFVRRSRLVLPNQRFDYHASAIQVAGNRVLIANGFARNVFIVDVSDPAHPAVLGRFDGVDASGIQVEGNRAYLFGMDRFGLNESFVYILDISNPAAPTSLGRWSLGWHRNISNLVVRGSRAYLADSNTGLDIVDLQNPAAPALLGRYAMAGIGSLDVVGERAYLGVGKSGLRIVDTHDPANPTLLGGYNTPTDAYTVAQGRSKGSAHMSLQAIPALLAFRC